MPKRRAIPQAVELELLRKLVGPYEVHHQPSLELRPVDTKTDEWVPHQHDPKFLVIVTPEEHKRLTYGDSKARAGGDRHDIDKLKRIEKNPAIDKIMGAPTGLARRYMIIGSKDEIAKAKKIAEEHGATIDTSVQQKSNTLGKKTKAGFKKRKTKYGRSVTKTKGK